jgi:hypothetical protein
MHLYATVNRYGKQHGEWMFLWHEDLSADPESGFQAICQRTAIPFAGAVAEELRRNTATNNPVDAPVGATHALMRNSTAIISRWRQQLDASEIAEIRASVENVSSRFYSDGEWPE